MKYRCWGYGREPAIDGSEVINCRSGSRYGLQSKKEYEATQDKSPHRKTWRLMLTDASLLDHSLGNRVPAKWSPKEASEFAQLLESNGQSQLKRAQSKPKGQYTGERIPGAKYRAIVDLAAQGRQIDRIAREAGVTWRTAKAVVERESRQIAERKQELLE